MLKIKVGDTVIVRKGSDRGSSGKVLEVNSDGTRLLVEGVNIRTIHQKPNTNKTKPAGIYKEPRMISSSNVGLAHPSNKGTTGRVGFDTGKDGSKIRVFKATGKEIK